MDTKTRVIDPACGMAVDPAKAAGSSDFGGESYWFCSAGCKAAFDADPAKYTGAPTGAMGDAHHDHHAHRAAPRPVVQLTLGTARHNGSTADGAAERIDLPITGMSCAACA